MRRICSQLRRLERGPHGCAADEFVRPITRTCLPPPTGRRSGRLTAGAQPARFPPKLARFRSRLRASSALGTHIAPAACRRRFVARTFINLKQETRAMSKALLGVCVTCVSLVLHARNTSAAGDIVLYAADATNVNGNWTLVADSTAAGGQLLSSADAQVMAAAPLAPPVDYFELTFAAPANTFYRIWFRVRAANGSKYNDSVYAQFSDAIDGAGNPLYAIGSTSALLVNGQSCSGCLLSGWGWIDGAYWLAQNNPLRFGTSGSHTLRVQTREDGVQIDQVVISTSAFFAVAPGSTINDTT